MMSSSTSHSKVLWWTRRKIVCRANTLVLGISRNFCRYVTVNTFPFCSLRRIADGLVQPVSSLAASMSP